MALILALETSGQICSVALRENGLPLFYSEFQVQKSHAEVLNVLVDNAFSTSSRSPKDISAVAVSIGPGSYTGLRIGLSSAKGFCFAWDVPLIAINTLEAMASQAKELGFRANLYVPMIDARRMEVFTASYNKALETIVAPNAFIFDDQIPDEWYSHHSGSVFFGDGVSKGKEYLDKIQGSICLENIYPKADTVAKLAYSKYTRSEFVDLAYQEPFYLKPFYTTAIKAN